MTTIIIDQAGSMPVGEVLRQAIDGLVELRNASGQLVATVTLPSYPTDDDYAAAITRVEADLGEIRRRRARPTEESLTLKELMAGLAARQS